MSIRQVKVCRACQGPLQPLFSLGDQYVIEYPEKRGGSLRSPLNLVKCEQCHLVQLEHSVDPDRLFNQFWYESALSSTMKTVLENIAYLAGREADLRQGETVLDIGSNDGTLLRAYSNKFHRVGFEPSNLARKGLDAGDIVQDYFTAEAWEKHYAQRKPMAITSIAMFYDLENPSKFCKDIASILGPSGVWIDQQNYLGSMIQNNAFDNIVHEHLCYFSLSTFKALLEKAGLQAYRVETNTVNGGSFRTYICHKDRRPVEGSVYDLLKWEKHWMGLDKTMPYMGFYTRIRDIRLRTLEYLIGKVRGEGSRVFIMGAGTRGNTIIQYYGLDETLIAGAVDKNPAKWGHRIVGTDIPILERKAAGSPDYFLILPYHFLDEFARQEKDYLHNGGHFIIPLPDLKLIP